MRITKLLIKSDSTNAVKWTKCPNSAPWRMRQLILQMERLKVEVKDWEIGHDRRKANQRADTLAKEGVRLQSEILRTFM
ncbi:Uncharacterized protein TCM_018555 [Theobroma cacao]|uniref:RNase H type-1 domain-containing protein n=1 Tax=Theobroma cacao TaxID=3641 RepID=A0A061EFM3_THECC|nr:Uncharacterized protein TCM_018555 [Theobroma cacao]